MYPPEDTQQDQAGWSSPLPEKLPRPTYTPFILALGIVLISFGLLTTLAISIVGLIVFIIGLVGWIGEWEHAEG
jgi:membrane-bound ClpP family serine protease